jgi:hypothetical protein
MTLRVLLCGMLVIATAALGAGAPSRVSMLVTPSVAFAPADLIVRTTVEANDENRALEVTAQSDEFYRSSEWPLEGGHAPRTARLELRGLPRGEYTIVAVLKGVDDEPIARTEQEIRIVSGGTGR